MVVLVTFKLCKYATIFFYLSFSLCLTYINTSRLLIWKLEKTNYVWYTNWRKRSIIFINRRNISISYIYTKCNFKHDTGTLFFIHTIKWYQENEEWETRAKEIANKNYGTRFYPHIHIELLLRFISLLFLLGFLVVVVVVVATTQYSFHFKRLA